jgi:hypothetical protein
MKIPFFFDVFFPASLGGTAWGSLASWRPYLVEVSMTPNSFSRLWLGEDLPAAGPWIPWGFLGVYGGSVGFEWKFHAGD